MAFCVVCRDGVFFLEKKGREGAEAVTLLGMGFRGLSRKQHASPLGPPFAHWLICAVRSAPRPGQAGQPTAQDTSVS